MKPILKQFRMTHLVQYALVAAALSLGSMEAQADEAEYPAGHWTFDAQATKSALKELGKASKEIESELGFGREAFVDVTEEQVSFNLAKEIPGWVCAWDVDDQQYIRLSDCTFDGEKSASGENDDIEYIDWLEDGSLNLHSKARSVWVFKQ